MGFSSRIFLKAMTPLLGSVSSSWMTNWMGWPSTPPASLMRLASSSMVWRTGTPRLAYGPVAELRTPNLYGVPVAAPDAAGLALALAAPEAAAGLALAPADAAAAGLLAAGDAVAGDDAGELAGAAPPPQAASSIPMAASVDPKCTVRMPVTSPICGCRPPYHVPARLAPYQIV